MSNPNFYFEPNRHNSLILKLNEICSKNVILYRLARKSYLIFEGFEWYLLKFTGMLPVQMLRKTIYKMLGMKIGKGSIFFGKVEVRCPRRIIIGNNTIIGHECKLDGRGGLEIGNNVVLSSGAWIWSEQHLPNDKYFRSEREKVVIQDFAWISSRSTILAGKVIGKGAVISTGSVVTKNVPDYTIVGGIPARFIAEREHNLNYFPHDIIPLI
jgi:acetyltransferase-like isoleucine patch superfamily enzyme